METTTAANAKRERTGPAAWMWSMSLADDETYGATAVFQTGYGGVGPS